MDPDEIRRQVIAALAADDELGEILVLKGGNALRLIHSLGDRASLDIDYSIAGDLPASAEARMKQTLSRQFASVGVSVFDVALKRKPQIDPRVDERPTWGGWGLSFKLIENQKYYQLAGNIQKLRNYAMPLYQERKAFQVDISKHEYVDPACEVTFHGYALRVYTPSMILFEKLRALCQQMSEYKHCINPTPRPRDFVDICSILSRFEGEVLADRAMLPAIFLAKDVPLELIGNLRTVAAFHEQGWASVRAQLTSSAAPFGHYFRTTVAFVDVLHPLRVVQAPSG
jgi:predicted nucleotidyltransferase component of viral defense system